MRTLRPHQLVQAVKAVCAFLGNLETLEVQESCDGLVRACLELDRARGNEDPAGKLRPEIVEEVSEGTIHKMCVYRNATMIMFYSTHEHHFFS